MSWEAWGTPPDSEPELCPICDNTQHTPDKCEVAASEAHSRAHYEGVFELWRAEYERRLTNAYAEGRKDEAADWNNVGRNGPPPCDGEAVFVGINTAGFACCFNEVTHDGVCSMQGPEICTVQMSGLEWWRVLSRPSESA